MLTLFAPVYLSVSSNRRGMVEHILPPDPQYIWVLGGVCGFNYFLEMTCLEVIYHIQTDSLSLDAQNPQK